MAGARAPKKEGTSLEERYNDNIVDPEITDRIVHFLEYAFPAMKHGTNTDSWNVEYTWQGIMGFTKDDNPLVGPLPHREGVYVVGGFNGDGMPKCFGSGKAIAEMISGKLQPSQFLQSFLPSRFKFEKNP